MYNYVVLIYFNIFLTNFNIYQHYIKISLFNLINVKKHDASGLFIHSNLKKEELFGRKRQ